MPVIERRFALRVAANLTAFLRLDAGLVRGPEPREGGLARERTLTRRVRKLQERKDGLRLALDDSEKRLAAVRLQLQNKQERLAELEAAASEMPQRWKWTNYIVSGGYRFIYLLVPKAASTSIQFALLPLFDYDLDEETLGKLKKKTAVTDKGIPVLTKGISFHGVHELFSLSPHRIGKAHFLAGMSKEYHRYFKFAFVRNPWDRLVSCYMSKIVMGGPGLKMRNHGDISLSRDMTFKEFAEAVCRIPDEESDPHFRSQYIVICDDSPGKGILADFVGRFENLEEDFGIVAKRLGLEGNLPETVSSADLKGLRSYRDFYDERLAEIVGERYRDDAKVFGYSF